MPPINSYKDNPLYPDRYDGDWVRVLPVPGRALQTAEVMEMQSIINGQMRMALSTIYRDGSPISGLRVIGQGPTYSVTNGMFYIQGMTLPVEGIASITPGLTNTIYVQVEEYILTEVDTPSLRDPIRGLGYGLEGAHRLVWRASITTVPGPSSYPIATIGSDGQVIQRGYGGPNDCINLLAAYTRDRMGDFLLHGLDVSYGGTKQSTSTPLTTYKKEEVERLSTELLEYNTLLTTSGTELSKVKVELDEAIRVANLSPSAPNRFIVDTKRKRVQELEAIMASLSSEVSTLNAQLSTMSSTVPLREVLLISPGVAYINGYRLEKVIPTSLEVPRTNAMEEVEAAKFTYISSPASSIRTLLPSGISTDGGYVSLTFTGIPYLAGYIDITATHSWSTSTRPLYDLVEAFQKGLCTYTSPQSIAPSTLKEALLRIVSISLTGSATILITSQYRDSLIGLSITSDRYEVDVPEAYLSASSPYMSSYELGRKPVSDIIRVVADLEATLLPITRGSSSDPLSWTQSTTRDALGDDTVFSIKQVVQGTQVYVEGRDYTLYGQGWIEWRPQVGPAIGTTYYVTYIYTQPLSKGIDYRLVGDRVELINATRRPAPGYTFTVDYTYSLPQAGRVYMDRDGTIGYSISPPSVDPIPPIPSPDTLSLATFTLIRGGVSISNKAPHRLTVADLSSLLRQYRERELLNTLPVATIGPNISITPSYITTPTKYLNVPIKYLGGGHVEDSSGGIRHLTLPYSTQPYLEQGRVTTTHTITPRPSPHIYIYPQVITATHSTGSHIYPCSTAEGEAPWSMVPMPDTPTATSPVLVMAMGLDDNLTYAVLYAGQGTPYTVRVGNNTSSGVRPVRGHIELYLSIDSLPGSYRVELRPIGNTNSISATTALTIIHPPYRQLGIDRSPLPNGLASSTLAPPLSQTVIVPEDIYLSSIGIALRYIDAKASVWVTIETLETIPKVLGMGILHSPTVSSKGEEITQVPLQYPIYLRGGVGYRLCIYVQGGEVDIYTATLGERDLIDGSRIGQQLLHVGELSVSGDGINNMPLPEEDLTHTLWVAQYLTNPVVIALGTYGLPDLLTPITAFCINGEDVIPPGTSILYEYKADSTWLPCTRGNIICIPPTSTITIRATMYTSKALVTPTLMLEGTTVTIYSNAESGVLGGLSSSPHTKVRLSLTKRGSQGTVTPSVSTQEGIWVPMTLTSTSPIGGEIRYVYEATTGYTLQSEYSIALWDRPLIRDILYEVLP